MRRNPGSPPQGDPLHGPAGWALLAIFWGTTIGLAVAHWFSSENEQQVASFVPAFMIGGVGYLPARTSDRPHLASDLASELAHTPPLSLSRGTSSERDDAGAGGDR